MLHDTRGTNITKSKGVTLSNFRIKVCISCSSYRVEHWIATMAQLGQLRGNSLHIG